MSAIPFYADSDDMAIWMPNRFASALTIETEQWVEDEDGFMDVKRRVTITVVQCSMCRHPARSLTWRDDNPTVCSWDCARHEDDAVEAACAAEIRRYEG
jgi:hypothetical protein